MDILLREAGVAELIAAGRERELTPDERVWLLLRNTFDDIEDNGLIGYYCGDNVDYMPALLPALETVRALDMMDLFEKVNQVCPGGRAPETAEEKEKLAEDWLQPALHKMFSDWENQYFELLPEVEELLDEVAARIWDLPEAAEDPDAETDDNIELSGDLVDYFSIDGDGLRDAEADDDDDDDNDDDCEDDDCDCGHHHDHLH